LVRRLESHEPRTDGPRPAAVSVILNDRDAPRILLIKRAERRGDPWSGQVAFPGGKFRDGDGSARGTATRETWEEVGIDLEASSKFLGYLRAFRTHIAGIEVVPVLFMLNEDVQVRANEEVVSYMWADLGKLASEEAKSAYAIDSGGDMKEVPAYRVGEFVVWGLTYKIISTLVGEESV